MNTQTKSYARNRSSLKQRTGRNRPDSFLPELGSERVFGFGYGRSSGYGRIDNIVLGSRLQFSAR